MRILKEMCSLPTAPFAEERVIEYVEQFVRLRPRLKLSRDRFGNLLIELPGRNRRMPRWVFTAHMDHPGFVAERMLDDRTLRAAFRGGVRGEYFKGTRVRFFEGRREIVGTVRDFTMDQERRFPKRALLQVEDRIDPNTPGMWDQGAARSRGGKFFSRVCDDLAGAAAALTMLDELKTRPPVATVAVLLTRAEEEGFIGAIAASRHPRLLRKSDRVIAIECSAVQPYAPLGKGAIIRVGDRTSVFNSGLTYFLTREAGKLAARDKTFAYQRALMPGGTCEATVYDIYGFTAASICVPLGTYHNMDVARKKIAAEYIDLKDWRSMVKLFVHVARTGHTYAPGHGRLKARVDERFNKLEHLL